MSREAQQLRFEAMIAMIGMEELQNAVILDAGCGTGDLAARLLERRVEFRRYIGIDAMAELVQAARERTLERCEFHVADLLRDRTPLLELPIIGSPYDLDRAADYIFISGTLNTMNEDLARDLVGAAFDAARRGVVFNFLSDRAGSEWVARDIGPSQRFATVGWLDWALRRTPLVSFSQEYLQGHDATILMRKQAVLGR